MKSAYELAMERLEKATGKTAPLSEEQKRAISDIEKRAQADVAEFEIMTRKSLAEAQAAGEADKAREIEERKVNQVRKIRERAEAEKQRVRDGRG